MRLATMLHDHSNPCTLSMHAVVRETVVVPDNTKPWQVALQEPHTRLVRWSRLSRLHPVAS